MTAPPAITTNPLSPVPSGISVTVQADGYLNATWNKWLVDLREKVNVINATLAAWSGIAPGNVTAGTYGDTTHYPIVTVNASGVITGISEQTSSGGGNPYHVTTITSGYTILSSDVPASSSYRGMIVATGTSANTITIDSFANTGIPVGSEIIFFQDGSGATTISSVSSVTLVGPSITGGGQYSSGKALQIAQDTWAISGNLAWISGSAGDPYWNNVFSLVYFNGAAGSSSIVDEVSGITWSNYGSPSISSTQAKFKGTSGYFNGSSGIYVNKQAAIGTGDFTVDIWIYSTVALTNSTIICGQQDVSTSTVFQIRGSSSGAMEILLRPNGGGSVTTIDGATVVSINAWHLLSVSRVSGTVYVFLDGTLQTSATFSGNLNCSSHTFTYGGLYDGSNGTSFASFSTCYLNSCRITVGVGRYTSSFSVPTNEYPNT